MVLLETLELEHMAAVWFRFISADYHERCVLNRTLAFIPLSVLCDTLDVSEFDANIYILVLYKAQTVPENRVQWQKTTSRRMNRL